MPKGILSFAFEALRDSVKLLTCRYSHAAGRAVPAVQGIGRRASSSMSNVACHKVPQQRYGCVPGGMAILGNGEVPQKAMLAYQVLSRAECLRAGHQQGTSVIASSDTLHGSHAIQRLLT